MKLTDERVVPDLMNPMNGLLLEHIARYQFSIEYAKGEVLDLACGSGFGTQLIAKARKENITTVIGVDVSSEAILYARGRYYHPLVSYKQGSVEDNNFMNSLGLFDTIISFETIEHVSDDRLFLQQLLNRLKPGGTLVLSTPFGKGRETSCSAEFHYHQLTVDEFHHLFDAYPQTMFYYQKGVLIEPPRNSIHYPLGIAVCKTKED
ncbi:bifunctional 2-polyprenyl-6-hydroxyphenol methylase/3-demethylubiquinol 3-O-methyltransferase UbiG [Paenisporosarcina sp. TG20]|uniref:class I SAM-dependent methyltransferase n=1 Tax=Paenisporosarcina sp. TG20 TaxID=1211706 RepID=UPI0002EEF727|nr:class I SAM-dependent methyltransferase [Paenisporosarcina sp. TG20]